MNFDLTLKLIVVNILMKKIIITSLVESTFIISKIMKLLWKTIGNGSNKH